METPSRTFAKAITWQISGFVAMTLIGYLVTGSVAQGGVVAAAGEREGEEQTEGEAGASRHGATIAPRMERRPRRAAR